MMDNPIISVVVQRMQVSLMHMFAKEEIADALQAAVEKAVTPERVEKLIEDAIVEQLRLAARNIASDVVHKNEGLKKHMAYAATKSVEKSFEEWKKYYE